MSHISVPAPPPRSTQEGRLPQAAKRQVRENLSAYSANEEDMQKNHRHRIAMRF